MWKKTPILAALLFASSALAACSSQDQPVEEAPPADGAATAPADPIPAPPASDTPTLGLEGLGDLRIGEPIPAGSSWAVRGAQISDECLLASAPDFPGVYAIVSRGAVRRITVSDDSDVKLVEGIGVGATEQQVREWFGGFREEGHAYVGPPGKYLTAPNADSGDPAPRFEIGEDGKVNLIHIGQMPELGYVEGCA